MSGTQVTLQGTLFGNNEPGFTFEPWDITTLYQDRAGTTPVTAAGQSVGLRLDKSQGLRIGPELVTNGDFSAGMTGWTTGSAITSSVVSGEAQITFGGSAALSPNNWFSQAGKLPSTTASYKVTFDATWVSGGVLQLASGYDVQATISANAGKTTYTAIIKRGTSGTPTDQQALVFAGAAATVWKIDNISVRELAGNHEVAVSDAKRGVYGWMPKTGRRNLLNATDTLLTQSVTVTAVAHTLAFTGTGTVTLSGASTAGPLVGTGASNRVTLTFTPTAGSLTLTVSGSVTLAQLELGSTATAYQRVASQYDITEAGVPTCYYVQADGVDDAYVTPTITPNTDKVQVFAGVRKLSDAATSSLTGMSVFPPSNNGVFEMFAPGNAGATYGWRTKGTIDVLQVPGAFASPITNVLTGLADISGDTAALRVNGTQVAQSTTDQGTGNYLAYPAYIYGRGGTSLPFNGLDFGHAVRFGPNLDAATIARVESLIARNTPEVTL